MGCPDKKIVDILKEMYPAGTRVRLIKMDDFQAPPAGTEGVVSYVDDIGTIHVRWDNGSGLGLAWDEDQFEKIE